MSRKKARIVNSEDNQERKDDLKSKDIVKEDNQKKEDSKLSTTKSTNDDETPWLKTTKMTLEPATDSKKTKVSDRIMKFQEL